MSTQHVNIDCFGGSGCYGDSYTALEGELNISVDLSSWNRAPSREKPGLVVARILNEANETVVWKSLAPSIALEQTGKLIFQSLSFKWWKQWKRGQRGY